PARRTRIGVGSIQQEVGNLFQNLPEPSTKRPMSSRDDPTPLSAFPRRLLLRRGIWTRRAGRDWRMEPQALFKVRHDLHGRPADPSIRRQRGSVFFLWIADEIEDQRHAKLGRRRPPSPLLSIERQFPVLPFDRLHAVGDVYWEPLARGVVGFSEQKLALVMPSIARSWGIVAPENLANVVKVSTE